jgi:NADPH-dependent curcumin reductase CurA
LDPGSWVRPASRRFGVGGAIEPATGLVIARRLTLSGFIVIDHQHRTPDMIDDANGWLCAGKLAHTETAVDGLNKAPAAFINLLRGASTGKMIVRS